MSLTRRRMLDDTYKKTVTGNPAIAQGSLARMYPGITMQGWTEQDGTTGANLFDKSAVIKNKYINDNTGEMYDEAESDTSASDYVLVRGLSYIRVTTTTFAQWMAFYDINKDFISGINGYGEPIQVPQNAEYARFTIPNPVVDTFMVNAGSELLPWEPYTGRKPSPSPDYPQEIVSAGKYNEDTQKWEYEITITNTQTDPDKKQTVLLTSDRPLTKWDKLEKRNGQWGWVYKSAKIVLDGSEKWSLYQVEGVGTVFLIALPNMSFGLQTSLCDKYRNINYAWDAIYNGVFGIYSDNAVATNKYFRPPSAAVETVEQWKAWLSENPLTLWYETAEETFIPLSESEQEQMNALHTNRPTTALSNDADCDMSLTYKTRKSMEVTT